MLNCIYLYLDLAIAILGSTITILLLSWASHLRIAIWVYEQENQRGFAVLSCMLELIEEEKIGALGVGKVDIESGGIRDERVRRRR